MNRLRPNSTPSSFFKLALAFAFAGLTVASRGAEVYLNEIFFNPPGTDTNTEYLELRGTPNYVLPNDTWFVAVEGNTGGNLGAIRNTIDLSRRAIGQNGFLVLFQKLARYKPHPYSVALTNAGSGDGWGSGSSSSLRHRGAGSQTELENPSVTFLLIQCTADPGIGDDIDANDDGTPDGAVFSGWTVLDSVGILDGDATSDTAYGRINFRRSSTNALTNLPIGPVISVPFTPGYVARNGNTTAYGSNDWVAGDNLLGKPPKWKLASNSTAGTNTYPSTRAGAAVGTLGSPNFAAPIFPSVLVREIGVGTQVAKGGKTDSYLVSLATKPEGPVTIRATAAAPLEVSLDGRSYSNQVTVTLTSTKSRKILTRVPNDHAVGPSLAHPIITHAIVATSDSTNYPPSSLILPVHVTVTELSAVVLNEAKVNPPGINDGPFEYIELLGPPGKRITNLFVLAIPGDSASNPGRTELAFNLSGQRFGTNGHLVLVGSGNPYTFSTNASVVEVPEFALTSGALANSSLSLLLVGSWGSIPSATDLDAGDNGLLEGLPDDAVIMDAVAWKDEDNGDVLYGPVDITQKSFTPDAVSRIPGNVVPNSPGAWMAGDLFGVTGDSIVFDPQHVSTNLPPGSLLTPGYVNATAPSISPLTPVSHVLGDPDNPVVTFVVGDDETPVNDLRVFAATTNAAVVPDSNLVLTLGTGGRWTLRLTAVGIGYADIVLTVSDGTYAGVGVLHFAASAPGRPGGLWHTGISDASTAMPIDSKWMFVGDDENQTLRIYSRTQSGGPVAAMNFNSFLGLVDFYNDNPSTPKEVDIEGSTRVGNRIFWLGSHSHSADTMERTNRARLFATDISGSGTNSRLAYVGRYDYLKLDLLAWDQNGAHGKGANFYGFAASGAVGVDPKSPDGSGFNIEGLCLAPGSTTEAYLAFRAPLVPPARAKAIIVPVTNFTSLAAGGGPIGSSRFGPPIELNLGGRGIRSIEGTGTNYLIVAGPAGAGTNLPAPGNFRLFTWSGRPADAPVERAADLTGLNVEGIVEVPSGVWTPSTPFQLISDSGTNVYYGDDIQAKHLPVREFKKFRMDVIELGAVGPPAALIRMMRPAPQGFYLEWFSRENTAYRLQMRNSLSAPWSDYGSIITATDAVTSTIVPLSEAQRFFRITTEADPGPK